MLEIEISILSLKFSNARGYPLITKEGDRDSNICYHCMEKPYKFHYQARGVSKKPDFYVMYLVDSSQKREAWE